MKENHSTPVFRNKIEQLISKGQTEKAIAILVQEKHPEGALLKIRFEKLQENFSDRRIMFGEWSRSLSKINYSILHLWPEETPPVSDYDFKMRIKRLIEERKIMEALQLMIEKGYRAAILSKARYVIAQAHFADQPEAEEWLVVQANVTNSMLHILELDIKEVQQQEKTNQGAQSASFTTSKKIDSFQVPKLISKSQLQEMFNKGKTKEVLQICEGLSPAFTLLSERFKKIQKDNALGIVSTETVETQGNQIDFSLRELIAQLPEGEMNTGSWKSIASKHSPSETSENNPKPKVTTTGFWNRLRQLINKK